MQMGAGLGISARYVRTLSAKMTGRVAIRAGMAGVEVEIGANRQISQFSTAGMSVSVGLAVRSSIPICYARDYVSEIRCESREFEDPVISTEGQRQDFSHVGLKCPTMYLIVPITALV